MQSPSLVFRRVCRNDPKIFEVTNHLMMVFPTKNLKIPFYYFFKVIFSLEKSEKKKPIILSSKYNQLIPICTVFQT